jgi:hypothetical protein
MSPGCNYLVQEDFVPFLQVSDSRVPRGPAQLAGVPLCTRPVSPGARVHPLGVSPHECPLWIRVSSHARSCLSAPSWLWGAACDARLVYPRV